jgi:cytochrome c biogenesis protein CcmG, thiol:disulfide interchange protein DsbE
MTVSLLRRIGQIVAVALVLSLFGLLVWRLTEDGSSGIRAAADAGKRPPAPDFTLSRFDRDGVVRLASLRGKVVVLNFWASWCDPCKGEAPRLEEAWRSFRRDGVVVVGVDAQDFSGDARRFMRRYKLTYPNVHDGPGDVLPKYGVTGFPETYFVGRDGRLVGERVQGEISEEKLLAGIKRALAS